MRQQDHPNVRAEEMSLSMERYASAPALTSCARREIKGVDAKSKRSDPLIYALQGQLRHVCERRFTIHASRVLRINARG